MPRMRSARAGMALVVVLALGGCGSSASPSPSGSGAAEPARPSDSGPDVPVGSLVPGGATAPPSGSSGPDIAGSGYRPGPAKAGGTVVVGEVGEANAFQPYLLATASDRDVAAAVWSSLVTMAPDGHVLPVLASSVPTVTNGAVQLPGVDGDAMTVRWQLRTGLSWSDGKPLTCDDVRYTWQWATDPDNVGIDQTGFDVLTGIDCPSATDMVWHFARPYEGYLSLVTTPLPRHALEPIAITDQVAGKGFLPADLPKLPVSGPFRFASAQPGGQLKLVRNPAWANPFGGKPASLDGITWKWFATPAALVSAFRAGAVDVAPGLAPSDLGTDAASAKNATRTPSLTYESLVLNWAGGSGPGQTSALGNPAGCALGRLVWTRGPGCPVADVAVRGAILRAIDRGSIAAQVYGGTAQVVDSGIVPDAWFSPPSVALPGHDPAAARTMLDRAGWTVGPDGVRSRAGVRARIEICSADDPVHRATAARITADLAGVGIEAVTDPVPQDTLDADPPATGEASSCTLSAGAFDTAQVSRTSAADPLGLFYAWHSSQIPPNGTNIASVADPDIDQALAVIESGADPVAIRDAVGTVARLASEHAVEVPLVRHTDVTLAAPAVGNLVPDELATTITWNAGDWFRTR